MIKTILKCPRCSDPTELKTYSSAMICPKCKKVTKKYFLAFYFRISVSKCKSFDDLTLSLLGYLKPGNAGGGGKFDPPLTPMFDVQI